MTLKYVEHVLSVERVYWLKKIAIEEEHEPVVTTAPILTLPDAKLNVSES